MAQFKYVIALAMVTLAMLFALQQEVLIATVCLLSTHDIVELLSYYLPIKKNSEQRNLSANGQAA